MTKFSPVSRRKTIFAWVLVLLLAVFCIGIGLFLENSNILADLPTNTDAYNLGPLNTKEITGSDNTGAAVTQKCKNTISDLEGKSATQFAGNSGLASDVAGTFSTNKNNPDTLSSELSDMANSMDDQDSSDAKYLQWLSQEVKTACPAQIKDPCEDTLAKLKQIQQNQDNSEVGDALEDIINNYENPVDVNTKYSDTTSKLQNFDTSLNGNLNQPVNYEELKQLGEEFSNCSEETVVENPCEEAINKAPSLGHPELIDYINFNRTADIKKVSAELEQGNTDEKNLSTLLLNCIEQKSTADTAGTGTGENTPANLAEETIQQIKDLQSEANKYFSYAQSLQIFGAVLDAIGLSDLAQVVYNASDYYLLRAQLAQDEAYLLSQGVGTTGTEDTGPFATGLPEEGVTGDDDTGPFSTGLPSGASTGTSTGGGMPYSQGGFYGDSTSLGRQGSQVSFNNLLDNVAKYTKAKGIVNLITGLVSTFSNDEKVTAAAENVGNTLNDFFDTMLEVYMIQHGMSYGGYGSYGGNYYNDYYDQSGDTTDRWNGPSDYASQLVTDIIPVDSTSSSPRIILHYAFESMTDNLVDTALQIFTPWGNPILISQLAAYNLMNTAQSSTQ